MTILAITILAALYFGFYKYGYSHGVKDERERKITEEFKAEADK
jgi:hypothetical protein